MGDNLPPEPGTCAISPAEIPPSGPGDHSYQDNSTILSLTPANDMTGAPVTSVASITASSADPKGHLSVQWPAFIFYVEHISELTPEQQMGSDLSVFQEILQADMPIRSPTIESAGEESLQLFIVDGVCDSVDKLLAERFEVGRLFFGKHSRFGRTWLTPPSRTQWAEMTSFTTIRKRHN